jgi:hypothetical protein
MRGGRAGVVAGDSSPCRSSSPRPPLGHRVVVAVPPFSSPQAGHLACMGDDQRRVTFDFAGAREVHYISDMPEVGDFVSYMRTLWVVRQIEPDDVDLLVTCERPRPQPGRSPDLPPEALHSTDRR